MDGSFADRNGSQVKNKPEQNLKSLEGSFSAVSTATFANKKLYLPSVNEIKDMIYKNVNKKRNVSNEFSREQDIYYFGTFTMV